MTASIGKTDASSQSAEGALVLLSGGQDSATCLAWALERYARVETIGFDYGQRHGVELAARLRVRDKLPRLKPEWAARLGEDHLVDLTGYGAITDTALTRESVIEYDARGLPTTFVPARNLVFFTVASAVADRRGLMALVAGVCETDYSGYPDCRSNTIRAMEETLKLGLDRPFHIETPLMFLSKAASWALAFELGGQDLVDLIRVETHSCYLGQHEVLHDWGYGCGQCPACHLRAKGYFDWRRPS